MIKKHIIIFYLLSGVPPIYPFYVFALAELTQFQADGELKGFKHENGRLVVQKNGYYYIYAQAFFGSYPTGVHSHNRVALAINGNGISLMQTGLGGSADYGSVFTAAVKYLKKDDYIGLKTSYPSKLWVSNAHTFFGAYRISK